MFLRFPKVLKHWQWSWFLGLKILASSSCFPIFFTRPILPDGPSLKVEMDWLGMWVSASSLQKCSMALLRGYDDSNSKIISRHKYKDNDKDDDRDKVPETANICWSPWPPWSPLSPWSPWSPQSPWSPRQGPRFSIRMVIGIFCSDKLVKLNR